MLDFERLCTLGKVDGGENMLKRKVWTGELGGNVVGGGVGHAIDSSVSLKRDDVSFVASELVDWILRRSRSESVQVGKRVWEQGRESRGEAFGMKVILVSSGEKGAAEL